MHHVSTNDSPSNVLTSRNKKPPQQKLNATILADILSHARARSPESTQDFDEAEENRAKKPQCQTESCHCRTAFVKSSRLCPASRGLGTVAPPRPSGRAKGQYWGPGVGAAAQVWSRPEAGPGGRALRAGRDC